MKGIWLARFIAVLYLTCVLKSMNADDSSRRTRDLPPHILQFIDWYQYHHPRYLASVLLKLQRDLSLLHSTDEQSREGDLDGGLSTLDMLLLSDPLKILERYRLPLAESYDPLQWMRENAEYDGYLTKPAEPEVIDVDGYLLPQQADCHVDKAHRSKHPEVIIHLPQLLQLGLDIFATSFPEGSLLTRNDVPAEVFKEPGLVYIEQIKLLHMHFPRLFDPERYNQKASFLQVRDHEIHLHLRNASIRTEVMLATDKRELSGFLDRFWPYARPQKRNIQRIRIDIEIADLQLDLAIAPYMRKRFLRATLQKPHTTIIDNKGDGRYVFKTEKGAISFRIKVHTLECDDYILRGVISMLLKLHPENQPLLMKLPPNVFIKVEEVMNQVMATISRRLHEQLFGILYPYLVKGHFEPLNEPSTTVPKPEDRIHCYDCDIQLILNPLNDDVPYDAGMLGFLVLHRIALRQDLADGDRRAIDYPVPRMPSVFFHLCRGDPYAPGCEAYRPEAVAAAAAGHIPFDLYSDEDEEMTSVSEDRGSLRLQTSRLSSAGVMRRVGMYIMHDRAVQQTEEPQQSAGPSP